MSKMITVESFTLFMIICFLSPKNSIAGHGAKWESYRFFGRHFLIDYSSPLNIDSEVPRCVSSHSRCDQEEAQETIPLISDPVNKKTEVFLEHVEVGRGPKVPGAKPMIKTTLGELQ